MKGLAGEDGRRRQEEGGWTKQSAKRGMCGKDARARDGGNATGKNQPSQQKDKWAVQPKCQRNDSSNARLAAKVAGIESVDSCTVACNDEHITIFVLSHMQLIVDLLSLSSVDTSSTAISIW
jgi:hypothetical protein